jgi:ABC-2 type transport system permease protein
VDTNVIDIAGLVKTFGSVRALDLLVLDEPTSGLDPLMESVFRPLRPHGEEDTGRVEVLLATALSRSAWLAGHVAVTVVGTLMVLALAGAGPGTSYALVTGDGSAVARMTVELLMTAPAVLVLAGFARLLHGLLPRATLLAWLALLLSYVVLIFGELLDLPQWFQDLSPFEHLALVPVEDFRWTPFLALAAVAAALSVAGQIAFRRRDVH